MALTKTRLEVYADQSFGPGGGPTPSPTQDVADSYQHSLSVRMVNGGTGPTTVMRVQPQVQYQGGSKFFDFGALLLGTDVASDVVDFGGIVLPADITAVRLEITHPAGQAVTLSAEIGKLTGL